MEKRRGGDRQRDRERIYKYGVKASQEQRTERQPGASKSSSVSGFYNQGKGGHENTVPGECDSPVHFRELSLALSVLEGVITESKKVYLGLLQLSR